MTRPLRILAFEPYDGGSHRAVRISITRRSRHEWTWFTAPPRAWKWRMRLAAPVLVREAGEGGAFERPADAIFATSLLSLGDLVASLPASHRAAPTILFMHENQAVYPRGHETTSSPRHDVHFAMTNLTSVAVADLVIWNSEWNRRSFDEGIAQVLRHAPEPSVRAIADRARNETVIWPPVEPPPPDLARPDADAGVLHNPVRVVWPHRWEHDKGPRALLEIARRETERLNLRWTILGERFRRAPPEFAELERELGDRIDAIGFEDDRERYWERLAGCDWVLSTAEHEFFGIAVVEAMLAGCLPWLPDRLSYPELLPACARGLSPRTPPADVAAVREAIRAHLEPASAAEAVARLDAAIEDVCSRRKPPATRR